MIANSKINVLGIIVAVLFISTNCQSTREKSSSNVTPERTPAKKQAPPVERRSVALEASQVEISSGFNSETGTGGLSSELGTQQVAASEARVEQILSELNAEKTNEGIIINLPENILFDFNKYELRPDAKPTLEKLNELISHYSKAPIAINGHTDSIGSDSYNQTLSEKRAKSVKDYLVNNFALDANRLSAKGFGKRNPIAPNTKTDGSDDPEGRQKNRRVEVVIQNSE